MVSDVIFSSLVGVVFIAVQFAKSFLALCGICGSRMKKISPLLSSVIFILYIACWLACYFNLIIFSIVFNIAVFVGIPIISVFLTENENRRSKMIVISLILFFIIYQFDAINDVFLYNILSINVDWDGTLMQCIESCNNAVDYISFVFTLPILIIIFMIRKKREPNFDRIPNKNGSSIKILLVFAILIMFIDLFIGIFWSISEDNIRYPRIITAALIIFLTLISLFLMYMYFSKMRYKNQLEANRKMLDLQEKKYEQTSASFKSISGIIHDTNKHLVYLRECAVQGDDDEAVRYIDTAINNMSNSYKRINTGHLVIDSLVSNAYNTAENNNITFRTDIKIDKDKITVERYDLNIVLGNMLDNAVEACLKIPSCEDRFIKVGIFTSENVLVINVVNSAVYSSHSVGMKSDKADKEHHGYGLGNINMIAEKYGGSFIAERKASSFEATVVLPIGD